MKFVWLDKDKYLTQIPFLKDNCEDTDESIDPDVTVYKIKKETSTILSQMKVMESCGFLKIIKEANELESAEDILHMTRRVEKLKSRSSPMYLKIYFPNATFLLSESDLMSSAAFRKCLLREGKFIFISGKVWVSIVQAWLDMSEEILEESEDEQIIDKVLNYLVNCVVHEDVGDAISRNTLYHDKDDDGVVYSLTDSIIEVVNGKRKEEISSRKLRVILSEYIDGNSIQKRIHKSRYRFWRFKIENTNISLDDQLVTRMEESEEDEKNNAQQTNIKMEE